MLYRGLAR